MILILWFLYLKEYVKSLLTEGYNKTPSEFSVSSESVSWFFKYEKS